MPSVYNLVKYDGSEVLSKGAALISTNEVEQLEWQQRGGVFILHKTAESTVLALRAVRQARAAAVTRAASAVGDKAQQGNKDLRPAAQRELKKRRVAVDVEQCAWWAVAVAMVGAFDLILTGPMCGGLTIMDYQGTPVRGLREGLTMTRFKGKTTYFAVGFIHGEREVVVSKQ
jgi:hypothetical protein